MTQAILIADDHPMCAAALGMATEQVAPGAEVVQVGTIAEAVAAAEQRRFDLVLLDLMLPDVQGFAGLLMLRRLQPRATIAIVSSTDEPAVMRRAAREGASGYIPKSAPMSGMVASIRTLLAGGNAFPPEMATPEPDAVMTPSRIGELSPAQFRVLRAAADGSQNKQIAYELGIAETTVKTHFAQIFRKLGVTNRTQAILALQALDVAA
ncbi:response regulator transcription factor [Sphingomonas sp. TREG-RG-20F-R18-01]|uniref:response regulator transcription factor n=1 Tax=Sphingomonas sp. TREG-RG-20F-R18-01 TaxID=2914982 RepID=UPI001F565E1A|nr:response regulator transcription factor [Sphingomonas sp. TREG-RG-20F-R18-01]